ncbi:hypothetical protein Dvar_15980 [Desulfosarcina variabilis str. Montpellier]|uniref:YVTN family beta-propeller repeat protein n=1 Tax=Desulfosarcina variabilis TaxID=2300 RepID=UPI003AFB1BCE
MRNTILMIITVCCFLCYSAGAVFAETTAYIADYGADELLQVFDTSDDVTSLEVGDTPYGVAVTPDGNQVLVTLLESDALVFINTSDFSQIVETLPVGSAPHGVAVDPKGSYAYVANYDNNTVSQVSLSTRTIVETIDVGEGPWGVAARYDEENSTPVVYVTNYNDGTVSVIGEDNEITTINVGDDPIGVAVTPDGNYAYVANSEDNSVSIIDTDDESVTDTLYVDDGPWGVAVGAQGDYVYVTNNYSDTVTVIQTSDNTIYRTFNVGDGPCGVSAPINGMFAYVVNQYDGSISRIDMDDESVEDYLTDQTDDAASIGVFIGDTKPSAPSDLEAETQDENTISLTWTDNSDDELGFKIERSKKNEDNYVQIATVSADRTSYESYNLSSDTTYYYRLRAYKEASDSDYSASATATTDRYTGSIWCFIGAMVQ